MYRNSMESELNGLNCRSVGIEPEMNFTQNRYELLNGGKTKEKTKKKTRTQTITNVITAIIKI